MKKVVLRKGREFSVAVKRHPWIFSGALEPTDAGAEMVEVFSADGDRLGVGFHSPASKIRVRMMPERSVSELVADAVGRRADFFANASTDAMRLVNAESDCLPGVVADFYAGWVNCQFTSAGAPRHAARKGWASARATPRSPFSPATSRRSLLRSQKGSASSSST